MPDGISTAASALGAEFKKPWRSGFHRVLGFPASGSSFGQVKGERAALSRSALHGDLSAVSLDDVLDNGKSQAGAAQPPAAGFIHAVETLEDAGQVLGGDPAAPVAHVHGGALGGVFRFDFDLAAAGTVFDGVVNQIDEGLFQED